MNTPAKPLLIIAMWLLVFSILIVPVVVAGLSPLLEGRNLAYVIGGMSGVVALSLLFMQPLLAAGYLRGIRGGLQKTWHRWVGTALLLATLIHVLGLFVTSPDDMIDAMLLLAPTPFSVFGVVGFWGIVVTTVLVVARQRIGLSPATWKIIHNGIAMVVVVACVVHALMIDGAMGLLSKWVLSVSILVLTVFTVLHLRVYKYLFKDKQT